MIEKLILLKLYAPDTYIYWGWAVLVALTAGVAAVWWRSRRRWLRWLLTVPLVVAWYVFIYGTYIGFRKIEVVHEEYASSQLPPAFDGYKIVMFSDAHVGSYTGWRRDILRRAVDSINAQQPDLVVFVGDLQNKEASEIDGVKDILSSIHARDGVVSVLGNHDYAMYLDTTHLDESQRYRCMMRTVTAEQDMGWTVLMNDRLRIRRDSSQIIIAGLENDGEGRFPQLGNITNALEGISRSSFVVMLEHDPTCWRRKILTHSHAQLTLSGHTHDGQFSVLGLSPAMFMYKERHGWYRNADGRALYVTKGLGGVVPFRFGATGEIVVITLKSPPQPLPKGGA